MPTQIPSVVEVRTETGKLLGYKCNVCGKVDQVKSKVEECAEKHFKQLNEEKPK